MSRYRLLTPDEAGKELADQLGISSATADERVARYLDAATAEHGVPLGGWRVDDDDLDLIRGFRLDEQPIEYVQVDGWEHGPDAATWTAAPDHDADDICGDEDGWFASGADAAHAEWLDHLAHVDADSPADAVERARAAVAALPLVVDDEDRAATSADVGRAHTYEDISVEGDSR